MIKGPKVHLLGCVAGFRFRLEDEGPVYVLSDVGGWHHVIDETSGQTFSLSEISILNVSWFVRPVVAPVVAEPEGGSAS